MADPAPELAEPERTIYLPQPRGHRRACLRFRNGLSQNLDMQPEELALEIDAFLADPSRTQLHLRDAAFGEIYVLPRRVVEKEVLDVLVAWVEDPPPQLGTRQGVMVAREMPEPPRRGGPGRRRLH